MPKSAARARNLAERWASSARVRLQQPADGAGRGVGICRSRSAGFPDPAQQLPRGPECGWPGPGTPAAMASSNEMPKPFTPCSEMPPGPRTSATGAAPPPGKLKTNVTRSRTFRLIDLGLDAGQLLGVGGPRRGQATTRRRRIRASARTRSVRALLGTIRPMDTTRPGTGAPLETQQGLEWDCVEEGPRPFPPDMARRAAAASDRNRCRQRLEPHQAEAAGRSRGASPVASAGAHPPEWKIRPCVWKMPRSRRHRESADSSKLANANLEVVYVHDVVTSDLAPDPIRPVGGCPLAECPTPERGRPQGRPGSPGREGFLALPKMSRSSVRIVTLRPAAASATARSRTAFSVPPTKGRYRRQMWRTRIGGTDRVPGRGFVMVRSSIRGVWRMTRQEATRQRGGFVTISQCHTCTGAASRPAGMPRPDFGPLASRRSASPRFCWWLRSSGRTTSIGADWDSDQGSEMLAIWNALHSGTIPQLGPLASTGTFHHGALYYDLMLPGAWLGGGAPTGVLIETALAGLMVVPMVWWVARSIGGPAAGLSAGLLAATSGGLVGFSTFIWKRTLIEPAQLWLCSGRGRHGPLETLPGCSPPPPERQWQCKPTSPPA